MTSEKSDYLKRLVCLIVFGIAFGFVEAVVVVYIRRMFNLAGGLPGVNYSTLLDLKIIAFLNPSSMILPDPRVAQIEFLRELATMVMLATLSFIAGQNVRQRLGAFMISFAVWDIFYYIFLNVLVGWPKSLFDVDIYFLIPVAWVGPVLTPVVISLMMLLFGFNLYRRPVLHR